MIRPSLVSLDLSSNHLDDLKDLVLNRLKKLDKLKNLILYGNPISVSLIIFHVDLLFYQPKYFQLIPNYRGFIVDTLVSLNYLDDQSISKDERLRYFNMKSFADSIKNESDVTITVSSLKNIYMPIELKVVYFYKL